MSQERLAEVLGVSRQWATVLVREMTRAGLVVWRYGRVTLLDQPGLHAVAEQGISRKVQRRQPLRLLEAAHPGHVIRRAREQ